jgi:hypothetical protein
MEVVMAEMTSYERDERNGRATLIVCGVVAAAGLIWFGVPWWYLAGVALALVWFNWFLKALLDEIETRVDRAIRRRFGD